MVVVSAMGGGRAFAILRRVSTPRNEVLADRQLAWLTARLTSDRMRAELAADFERIYDAVLARPVEEVVDLAAIEAAIDAALTKERFDRATRPATLATHLGVLRILRTEKTKVGLLVSDDAKKKIDKLLERPKLVNEKLVRRAIEQDAVEVILRDVMYDGLKEFNEKVNPFVAEWGLPGLLKKLGPFGLGPLGKSLDNVRAEFEKRLEPEMRKFLQGFSRKALKRAADLAVQQGDDANAIALRKSLALWVYEQELRELVANVDDENAKLLHEIVVDVTEHGAALEIVKKKRHDTLAGLYAAHAKQPLGAALGDLGISARPDFAALAAAVWPAWVAAIRSTEMQTRAKALLAEFFAEVDLSS